jgi:alkylation response protein AidB-like acyl-CoA dehydrogenase
VTDVPGPWPLGTDASARVAAMETSTTSTASAIATTATGDRRCRSRTGRLTGTSVVTATVTALPFDENYSDGFTIFEGTSEIQRMIIGRAVTGLDVH